MELQRTADAVRRAELFNVIADLVRAYDAHGAPVPVEDALPRVSVLDRRIYVNGRSLDLARRPLMLRLFRVFNESRGARLTREDLLRKVYCLAGYKDKSDRYLESSMANAVKLMSRTRKVCGAFLSQSAGPDFDWLVYDSDLKSWSLVEPRVGADQRVINS